MKKHVILSVLATFFALWLVIALIKAMPNDGQLQKEYKSISFKMCMREALVAGDSDRMRKCEEADQTYKKMMEK